MTLQGFVTHPLTLSAGAGAWAGLIAAVRVDYMAYKAWKADQGPFQFDFTVAAKRWAWGAVFGAAGGLGLGGVGAVS